MPRTSNWHRHPKHADVYTRSFARGGTKWKVILRQKGGASNDYSPTFDTCDEALTWRDERRYEMRHGKPRPPRNGPTLRSYGDEWLARRDPTKQHDTTDRRARRGRLAPSTFESYRMNLRKHAFPALGERRLDTITPRDADQFIADLEAAGKAPGTVVNIVVPIRRMLNDAVRQELIGSNPFSRCDLPPLDETGGTEIPVDHTRAIRNALVELAPPDPHRGGDADLFYVHLFDVAESTALRLGELRALTWQQVDQERRLLRVDRAYSRRHLKLPKSEAGKRAIPLFPSAAAALQALAARAVERGLYAPDELVFATAKGTPLHDSNLRRRVWEKGLERAGLDGLGYRLHDLRHTCVSRLVAAGADVKLIQAMAGHSDPRITLRRYSHLLDGRITDMATRYDPAGTP
jgi:integrase